MGYQTHYYGDLQIDPPVTSEERASHPELAHGAGNFPFGPYWVTEDGTKITTAEDSTRADHQGLVELARLLKSLNETRQITGTTYGEGEEMGDFWRAWVDQSGEVQTQDAELHWPDGSIANPEEIRRSIWMSGWCCPVSRSGVVTASPGSVL